MQSDDSAFQSTLKLLLDERTDSGHFIGELSASALSTATAISALSFYLKRKTLAADERSNIEQIVATSIAWTLTQQNEDGGWGDTDKNYSNISTTMLVEAALEAAGVTNEHLPAIEKARQYISAPALKAASKDYADATGKTKPSRCRFWRTARWPASSLGKKFQHCLSKQPVCRNGFTT